MRTLTRFRALPDKHRSLLPLLASCLIVSAAHQTHAVTLPIADWRFDEASGSSATDASSNGHTGTIVGAERVPGQMGGGLSFAGVNDHVFASDAQSGGTTGAGLDMGSRDWTVAAWVRTTASGMVVTKMGFVGGSNPDGWGVSDSGTTISGASSPYSISIDAASSYFRLIAP